ncbi:MAG: hypothetical protein ACTSPQ_18270 [Candidatus Helarchaeota archaeon]
MINAFDIYLISQLDTFVMWFGIFGILFTTAGITLVLVYACNISNPHFYEDEGEALFLNKCREIGKVLIIISCIFITTSIFLPSSKTVVAMFVVPKIVNNEDVQEMPQNVFKLMNEKLKEWTKDVLETEE